MKLLLVLGIFSFFPGINHKDSLKKETYYYFCSSRPIQSDSNANIAFYTEVRSTECDKAYMKYLAQGWGLYLKENCRNANGCTSDLNYYTTLEHAQKEFKSILNRYQSKSYTLVKVEF